MLHVCSLADMPGCVARLRPRHVVSLLPPHELPATPAGLAPERHLRLGLDDVYEALPGQVAPARSHIEALVGFAAGWDRDTPLLVHCFAGISRSTAAALILLCLESERREAEAAELLARQAPHAQPNRRMIELADELLGRRGRLSAAVAAMGPASLVMPGPLVTLPSRLPPR
ncbi:MAG: tyrosine phosphatase family protein [Kiloniellales bacterium]